MLDMGFEPQIRSIIEGKGQAWQAWKAVVDCRKFRSFECDLIAHLPLIYFDLFFNIFHFSQPLWKNEQNSRGFSVSLVDLVHPKVERPQHARIWVMPLDSSE